MAEELCFRSAIEIAGLVRDKTMSPFESSLGQVAIMILADPIAASMRNPNHIPQRVLVQWGLAPGLNVLIDPFAQ